MGQTPALSNCVEVQLTGEYYDGLPAWNTIRVIFSQTVDTGI